MVHCGVKAKFDYASCFEAGSKLVADRFEAKFHYAIWFEAGRRPASNQLRTCFELTSFEPDSIMEFTLAGSELVQSWFEAGLS